MKKNIALFGAFDRFNYGDLIFPIITEKVLLESEYIRKKFNIAFYSLKSSDLSLKGGKKTKSINNFFKEKNNEGSIIIIVGGEIIFANWYQMLGHLSSRFVLVLFKIIKNVLGKKVANFISRLILKGNRKKPWIVNRKKINNKSIVIYNSIGGLPERKLKQNEENELVERFKEADKISVRESKTKKLLDNISNNSLNISLAPDAAVL